MEDDVYIRKDLIKAGGRIAFYRLTPEMRDFINLIKDTEGADAIEGIMLTHKDDDKGSYGFNIGFILKEKEKIVT